MRRDEIVEAPAPEKGESIPVDDLLLQEIYSLREKLKIAVCAIKSYNPEFDTQEFVHRLNAVDFDQLMEELTAEAKKPVSRCMHDCGIKGPCASPCEAVGQVFPAKPAPNKPAHGDEDAGEANVAKSYGRAKAVHGQNWANVADAEWDASVLADEIDRLHSIIRSQPPEVPR